MARLREWSGWTGWFVAAAGTVLCVLGWYGISGESVAEQQLPYLASATIPGAALIVAGAVLISSRPRHTDQRIETLYSLLVTDTADPDTPEPPPHPEPATDPQTLLAVPGGTLYHRPDCPLVADKPAAEPIDAHTATQRGLAPCPVCEPPKFPPAAGPNHPAGSPDHPAAGPAADPADCSPGQPAGGPADHPAADRTAAARPAPGHPAARASGPEHPLADPSGPAPAARPAPDHPAARASRPEHPPADPSDPALADRPAPDHPTAP